jgi:hypothetical protein
MAESNPSLFIPFVFENISESRIYRIFDELALGRISRIDIVPRRNTNATGKQFNNVIIHFEYWYENREAERARRRIEDGKEIKIVYYKEYFWKVSAYRPKTRPVTTGPRLIFDDEEKEDIIPKKRQTNNKQLLHPNVTVRKKRLSNRRDTDDEVDREIPPSNRHDTDDEVDREIAYSPPDDENNT